MASMMNPTKWFSKKVGGEYELGKTLGKGHFSKVKLGVHIKTKKQVAIKIMERKALLEEGMEEQLKREIAIMRKLNHPNVTQLYEVFQTTKHVYLILELVTGGELFDKIVEKKRFPENLARDYFQQLVLGTYYCHIHDVAHRDLKPENLLLDDKGVLKISDFGLSNLQPHSGSGHVQPGMQLHTMCGTPEYVAPEVLRDQGYNGFTADIWSCGVILYVMLAGSLPFRDTEASTVFQKIKTAQYEMKSFFGPGAKDLIRHLLVVDPNQRYTLEQVVQHEWFRPGFDYDAWEVLRGQAKIQVNQEEIKRAVTEYVDSEVPEAPLNNEPGPVETPEELTRHKSFKSTAFAEKRSNCRFGVKGAPDTVVQMLTGILNEMNANPEVKNHFTIKAFIEEGNSVITFQLSVSMRTQTPDICVVEVRRSRGSTIQFHEIYRSLLEKLTDVIAQLN
jgi:serine/threonine protein kinase|eukprot:CAMPEP_0174293282 /NCGR_PEP_ID=MMETSP0809-20121228/38047_1 /TAXON_ID=73025 ORGANISM="Eutreptiella gymnastica-like, Strain CCMP1594" /NCGR_SAMPLE_ID=MMETSP0809 /ASSEMBLY_ACC=CAM_ASM_000658 /LENGTH=446 /DNA_ID=CAMNT_0015393941 /DNA_START=17 /DNA_END=1357 /DNA_ORIENTATION=+